VFHHRSPPAINTLKIITNKRDVSLFSSHHLHQTKLDFIGILGLIHEDKTKTTLPTSQNLSMTRKQEIWQEQQIIKINRICCY
jgi:hypothetical protein